MFLPGWVDPPFRETYNPARRLSFVGISAMIRSRIIGTGSYLPERAVSNREAASALGIDSKTVLQLTGIEERRWAAPSEASSDLALQAAQRALDAAGVSPAAVEAILLSTTSPDMAFPSTACHLQRKLGCGSVPAFDVAASCSGFLYGLSMADAMIRGGQVRTCLVVAAEVKSRSLDPTDANTAMLFGDGAGAVVLQGEQESGQPSRGVLGVRLHSDGSQHHLIRVASGGSRTPTSLETVAAKDFTLRMQGAPLFRLAIRRLEQAVREILKEFGVEMQDVAQVVLHQANGRILGQLTKRLGFDPSKVCSVIERYGNTSSASLPIALDHAVRAGRLRPHEVLLLGSFGGGLTWATGLLRW